MPLHLYRSNRTERLVQQLAKGLAAHAPSDPFMEQPIVVGSRGMERWLRNQIATHLGIATRLAFPFPGPALDGGVAALLGLDDPSMPFWERAQSEDTWNAGALPWRVVTVLRRLLADPQHETAMARVSRYLQNSAQQTTPQQALATITAREQTFAAEVASAVDELLRMRPDTAQQWLLDDATESRAEDEGWLALVLRALMEDVDALEEDADEGHERRTLSADHPAWRRVRLAERVRQGVEPLQPVANQPALHIFGLSTLPAEELKTLALISGPNGLDVHLYQLAPSRAWFGDMPTREETRIKLRRLGRELDRAGASAEVRYQKQCDIIEKEEQKNRILADLGRPSRDVQALLELHADHYQEATDDGDDLFVAAHEDVATSVLGGLQDGLLEATSDGGVGERITVAPHDSSLLFLPCHGPLRQVEELRERLLAAFSRDVTLQPRDVLVMTPDIATFAPLVAAVFADESVAQLRDSEGNERVGRLPAIPVDISDLGLRATNRVADVLLTVMELATERITLPNLLNLLQLAPLRERFGLAGEDYTDLQRLLLESGVRWGIDADDRAQADQPALHQNTLNFGMERVALGALFLDETDLIATGALPPVVRESTLTPDGMSPTLNGEPSRHFAPFAALDSTTVGRFGRLYGCVTTVLHHRDALREPATARQWQRRFEALIDELTATSDESAWLTSRVLEELRALTSAAQQGVGETPIDLASIRAELQGRFDLPRKGDRPVSGGVSVCAMEPMRSVPFRIVALLGMNQESFPRQSRRRAWHPMTHGRRIGEHDSRDIDRHLLLEALLSAREQCMVLWTGFNVQTGEPLPEAVPIRELGETIDLRFTPPISAGEGERTPSCSAWLTRPGTLQPWSERGFTSAERLGTEEMDDATHRPSPPVGFDVHMCQAAELLRRRRAGTAAAVPARIIAGDLTRVAAEPNLISARSMTVEALARTLCNPSKILLSKRFGLRLVDDALELESREALELNGLQTWQLRRQALQLAVSGQRAQAATYLSDRWRAEGVLPIGPAATTRVQEAVDETVNLLEAALLNLERDLSALSRAPLGQEVEPGTDALRPEALAVTIVDAATGSWGLVLDNALLVADPQRVGSKVLLVPFVGSLNMTRSLTAWLALLVAVQARPSDDISGALVVTRAGAKEKAPGVMTWFEAPTHGAQALKAVLRVWRQAQVAQVPLFQHTSWALAEALVTLRQTRGDDATWWLLSPEERQTLRGLASQHWASSSRATGDEDDRWVAAIWGAPDFDDVLPEATTETVKSEPDWIAYVRELLVPIWDAQHPYDARPQAATDTTRGDS